MRYHLIVLASRSVRHASAAAAAALIAGPSAPNAKPSSELQEALSTLDEADGLIAVNLNRFVEHLGDRLRDIRPFLHHFFCHTHKHLITIEDGVDTRLPAGQLVAFELIHDLQDKYQL